MTHRGAAVLAQLVVLAAGPAAAEPPVAVETTKLGAEDAPTTDAGALELELGVAFARATRAFDGANELRDRRPARTTEVALTATYGLTDGFDVAASLGWAHLVDREAGDPDRGSGLTDLAFRAKWHFFSDEAPGLDLAALAGFTAPAGTRSTSGRLGPSAETWSFDARLALTGVRERWTANVDLGLSAPFTEDRGDARGTFDANAAVGYQALPWLQPEIEIGCVHDFFEGAEDADALHATAGFILNPADAVRVDLGVRQTLYGRHADLATAFVAVLSYTW